MFSKMCIRDSVEDAAYKERVKRVQQEQEEISRRMVAVSYTHLDVYKRQVYRIPFENSSFYIACSPFLQICVFELFFHA